MNEDRYASIREAVDAVRGVFADGAFKPGAISRFDDREGRRGNRACWLYLSADEQIAVLGNWRAPELRALYVRGGVNKKLTSAERAAIKAHMREASQLAAAVRALEWGKASAIALEIVRAMRSAVEVGHAYLCRKRVHPVEPLGVIEADAVRSIYLRSTGESASWLWSRKLQQPMSGELLVVPCFLGGFHTRLSSVELIDATGSKVSLKGGRMAGAFWFPSGVNSSVRYDQSIAVAEGIATALSISQVKGFPCAAARSCGNLLAAAHALRNRFPHSRLIVCGDKGNGEDAARKAAASIGALFAAPAFSPPLIESFKRLTGGDKPTDFNDYFIATEVL